MKFRKALAVLAVSTLAARTDGLVLDVDSVASIKSAASQIAGGLVEHWFKGEQAAITAGFEVPAMWFWWEAGELWTGLINYWSYTGDSTYLAITHQYLQAQVGPYENYMLPSHKLDEANDDQAHWGFAAMTAAEKDFPQPDSGTTWLQTVENLWHFQATQWDTTSCGGGLRWGIEAADEKYDYKNSITNGAFFQLSARLALKTGNAKYAGWAQKSFDWAVNTGIVTGDYKVLDGVHVATCNDHGTQRWSINHGIYLYGAAVMYKQTGSATWKQHTDGLLNTASAYYFHPPNALSPKPIMWEPDCELDNSCNNDMKIFKSSMARYMYETAAVAPHTSAAIFSFISDSATGAANACMGAGGSLCGSKWYSPDDGAYGPASQLSALEVIQGLLLKKGLGLGNAARDTKYVVSTSPKETQTQPLRVAKENNIEGTKAGTSMAPVEPPMSQGVPCAEPAPTVPVSSPSTKITATVNHDEVDTKVPAAVNHDEIPTVNTEGPTGATRDEVPTANIEVPAAVNDEGVPSVNIEVTAAVPTPATETPAANNDEILTADTEATTSVTTEEILSCMTKTTAVAIYTSELFTPSIVVTAPLEGQTSPLTLPPAQTQTPSSYTSITTTSALSPLTRPHTTSSSTFTLTSATKANPTSSARHDRPDPSPSTTTQPVLSSDPRFGPSFALLVFCIILGSTSVLFC